MARPRLILLAALPALLSGRAALAADVEASAPQTLSVTLYRAPSRASGSLQLNNLQGFALVTEVRTVRLPAGTSRLRFEGVVDGIDPATAIVTGLPDGVIEKNRDADVLSPESLVRSALGQAVTLTRTDWRTGHVTRVAATIRSADAQGVVFDTAEGAEALHCSGLAETFSFARLPAGLSSTPTLSVLTKAPRPVTARVTLSYLARGFDWSANYVADIGSGGAALNLTGWITLANANSVGLPNASTQIVAGRLNRSAGEDAFPGRAPRVIARCWPQGTTSDISPPTHLAMAHPYLGPMADEIVVTASRQLAKPAPPAMMALNVPAPPPPPPPEDLGDLKLYRLPEHISIAANQMKQVRLLEAGSVPFTRVAVADIGAVGTRDLPARMVLRATNDEAHKLGVPLPAGGVAVMDRDGLVGEARMRDLASGEVVEINLGPAVGVLVRQQKLAYVAGAPDEPDLTPELREGLAAGKATEEVAITNDRPAPIAFELRLQVFGALHVLNADQPMALKDGRPIFRLTLPANGSAVVRYEVADK